MSAPDPTARAPRQRLDQALVARGLVESRARAQALIAAGAVTLDGAPATRASAKVAPGVAIELVADPLPWVSRAALKLAHALDAFGLAPEGEALDLGASTGGFTEVLLARGAARVHAVDAGRGQLHAKLRENPRVVSLEGLNARDLVPGAVPAPDWIVADLSFIGLAKALPPALAMARPGACLVALVKPQFEAGPADVGRGGLVRDPAVHARVRAEVRAFLETSGWTVTHEGVSPIEGGDGNREFLISAEKPR
ncbi:TlyA family RNA methyltransferase [uncultured Albimonas sp.]|uniref:TlyA family RNA methyltransferase n=1 Tax=uncultured Albimonas sp. TaxID=1331701 RepID=UPI0030EF710C|tara:strand:- start:813 stop:1571 length:759 start_codon:yes stop_codon:yes gene_type:complete